MNASWATRRGSKGYCGHRHPDAESAARCAHLREVRYECLGEPAQVVVVAPGGRELTGEERLAVGRIMSGLSVASAPEPQTALPVLCSRAVLMALAVAAEQLDPAGAELLTTRAAELATEALARLLVAADRMPAKRAPRGWWTRDAVG